MNKTSWIICIGIFIFITTFVISLDSSKTPQKVQFTNQNLAINNEGNKLVNNSDTQINFKSSNINNKKLKTQDSNIKLKSSDLKNTDIKLADKSKVETQNINYKNSTSYENKSVSYNNNNALSNKPIQYKNLDDSELDNAIKNAKNISNSNIDYSNKPFKHVQQDKYAYKNIDWSTWKSNFVNTILEDSLQINSLNDYSEGSWFYYSFVVDNQGRISNITIKSMFLDDDDKVKIKRLIKSYEFTPITTFPEKSKRTTANVSAVMILSDETKKASPHDFNDFERVKFKL